MDKYWTLPQILFTSLSGNIVSRDFLTDRDKYQSLGDPKNETFEACYSIICEPEEISCIALFQVVNVCIHDLKDKNSSWLGFGKREEISNLEVEINTSCNDDL